MPNEILTEAAAGMKSVDVHHPKSMSLKTFKLRTKLSNDFSLLYPIDFVLGVTLVLKFFHCIRARLFEVQYY